MVSSFSTCNHFHFQFLLKIVNKCKNTTDRGDRNGTHSSPPAWKMPWMEEPGGLQSMELQRVGHDWATSLSFCSSFWRRKWHPTPVFLPGESHGQRGLVGCSLWGCTESDTTKQLTHTHTHNWQNNIFTCIRASKRPIVC